MKNKSKTQIPGGPQTKSQKLSSTKKKSISIAVVGSTGLDITQARVLVKKLFARLATKYTITLVATIHEDVVGWAGRDWAKANKINRKTYKVADQRDQSTPVSLAVGSLMWSTTNFVLVDPTASGMSIIALDMITRMGGRKYIIIDI